MSPTASSPPIMNNVSVDIDPASTLAGVVSTEKPSPGSIVKSTRSTPLARSGTRRVTSWYPYFRAVIVIVDGSTFCSASL